MAGLDFSQYGYEKTKFPLLVFNFKTYRQATGSRAEKLAIMSDEVSDEYGVGIVVCPQAADIYRISGKISIPIFAQHIDDRIGKYTGSTSPLVVKQNGAIGTLLNHSENGLTLPQIRTRIESAKDVGLFTLCFAESVEESLEIARYNPDMIAYEPPELVGTGISVSSARPEVITEFARKMKETNPEIRRLCGAGIRKGQDVIDSIKLGADGGVVFSSGPILDWNQKETLIEYAEAIKTA